jgi:predicted short-subunit dehydrogenase-like oxidoreductase (DUF2520 family)
LASLDAVRLALDEAAGELVVVWLTVPDDTLATVASETAAAAGRRAAAAIAVHTSGLSDLSPLEGWRRAGAQVLCLHPLQSFAERATATGGGAAPDWFDGVPIAVTAGSPRSQELGEELAATLGGRPFALAEEDKATYHLAAAVASNLLVALQSQAAELMRQATHRASATEAMGLLGPLVHTTLENVLRLGPERALTGPVARGDAGTVRAHLGLLAREPARLGTTYRALSLQALALAAPRLDDETVQTLQRLLGGYPDQAATEADAC